VAKVYGIPFALALILATALAVAANAFEFAPAVIYVLFVAAIGVVCFVSADLDARHRGIPRRARRR